MKKLHTITEREKEEEEDGEKIPETGVTRGSQGGEEEEEEKEENNQVTKVTRRREKIPSGPSALKKGITSKTMHY